MKTFHISFFEKEFLSSITIFIVQLGPSTKANLKSWFGAKRNTKFTLNHPPTHTNFKGTSRQARKLIFGM